MYRNGMYVGRCAEGYFMRAELGEFIVAVIVYAQNMNSLYRLLYKLHDEISHGQRIESNVAVVKFRLKTSADVVVIDCYKSICSYFVRISPSLPTSERTVGFPPLQLSSYSLDQTRGHQKLTEQYTSVNSNAVYRQTVPSSEVSSQDYYNINIKLHGYLVTGPKSGLPPDRPGLRLFPVNRGNKGGTAAGMGARIPRMRCTSFRVRYETNDDNLFGI